MNQDPLSITLTQISHLVSTLNKKNFAQNSRQVNQLVKEFGFEADRHYLRVLFSAIDFGDAAQVSKTSLHAKLLSIEFGQLLAKPSFVSLICFAFDHWLDSLKSVKPSANLLTQIGKALNFTTVNDIVLAYALQQSQNKEITVLARDRLYTCLAKLIQSYAEVESNQSNSEGSLNDITPELLQIILTCLSEGKNERANLRGDIYKKFIQQLCNDFPRDRVPLVLAPLLYREETESSVHTIAENTESVLLTSIMDTSWSKLVFEIGYAFTASLEECKNHLTKFGGRDIKSTDVARIITLMCQTHTNPTDANGGLILPTPASFWPGDKEKNNSGSASASAAGGNGNVSDVTTWKPDVFVQALKEVVPNLIWKEVCFALDHPDFLIKDRAGLNLLITTIRLGYQSTGAGQTFPAECLYRHWENCEGQLSLIDQILKNSDIISFADHIFSGVSTDLLKTPPELDNKDIATWKSLHLVEVLLYIADHNYCQEVMEIFKVPIQHCPDLLFFALLQIKPPLTGLRQELFQALVPIFLGNHPNSAVVLQHAWNSTILTLKHIIMHSMSEWYLRGDNDQTRLSRILDVAQDLKALSTLLNLRSFMFVIDLACLASRREYLKLEKWLSDKIREHGEQFIQTTVKFLQRRCPQLIGGKIPDDQLPKAAQLPTETMTTILSCLHAYIGNVSPELNEMIIAMTTNCNILMNKSRQQTTQPPLPNVLRPPGGGGVPPPGTGTQQPQPPPPQPQLRGLESQFNANQMFGGNQSMDAFTSAAMSGLNLGAGAGGGVPNANFNFNMLSNILPTTPVSPSRLLNASTHNAFSLMPNVSSNPSLNLAMNNRIQAPASAGIADKMLSNAPIFPDVTGTIPKEIEEEANSYFQRIYNHPPHPTLSIDEVLDMLQRFQDSQNPRERDVYQCMIRNLFEEYRFFPNYPEKELQITAQLFGGMVERNLVKNMFLGLALRCVLEALRKLEGSKMYFFGITALDRFKTKLHKYQKYCEYVRTIPHFEQFPPHLIDYVEYGLKSQEPPTKPQVSAMPQMMSSSSTTSSALYNRSNSVTSNLTTTSSSSKSGSGGAVTPSAQSRVKSIANATNIDTLLVATQDREEKIIAPPDTIQDKTAFIFNNLSQLNLQQKCEEVKEIMSKEYWPWMAQYLVLKRASIEVNFHLLYSNFLDVLKIPEINRLVTKETFRNIRVLLRTDKSSTSFSDRSLLKNLGHWLGMMTLGRNRPILQLDIDLKSLIMEAYIKGQSELLYVVPFVAKVLESCAKSRVFKPPNPWTMAIMNVLAELHQEPDLKLNLKFEIEVLCKNFNIDVSDLKPVVYLKDPDKVVTEYQLSQPNKQMQQQQQQQQQKDQQQSSAMMANVGNMQLMASQRDEVGQQNAISPSADVAAGGRVVDVLGAGIITPGPPKFSYLDINVTNSNCIGQLMTISPNIAIFHAQPHLKAIVRAAIERTITEWLTPVVDSSVKKALTACEQIIRKDFAMDIDEMHMRAAAHYMVRNLTAGMAMFTCREQLSQAITTNVKNAFLGTVATSPAQQKEMAEATAIQIAVDNMELACAFIQKSAVERAIIDIDKRLAADYEVRKHARREGRPFIDTSIINYQMERMPEQIRLTGNITKQQFAVYEEFAKNIPGFQPATAREMAMFFPKPNTQDVFQGAPPPPSTFMSGQQPGLAAGAAGGPYTPNFMNADDPYDELSSKIDAFIVSILPIPVLIVQVKNLQTLFDILMNARRTRDSTSAYTLLTKSVEFLLEGYVSMPEHVEHIKLYRDILLRVMRLLQETPEFGLITKAVFDCREEIRYNLEAVDVLITANLISLPNFDILLSQSMENGSNYLAVNFAIKLMQHYLIDDRLNSLVSEKDFVNTIDLLTRLSVHHPAPEGLVHLIDILRLNQDPNIVSQMGNAGNPQLAATGLMGGPMRGPGDHDDPGLQQKIEYLLNDWVTMYHSAASSRDPIKAFSLFTNKLNVYGILKTDELITKFFHQATKHCVEMVYRQMADQNNTPALAKSKIFHWIDAYVRLIVLLVKHSGDTNLATKVNLLNKVLCIVVELLLQDQEKHGVAFQQVGYHRIFIMLFLDLSAPDPVLESISFNVVTLFSQMFHLVRPSVAPGFCYSWLDLISHRVFLGRCLAMGNQQKGWSFYSQLMMDLFKYLAPFLRNAELAKPVQLMYKGTLRVLLVLLHDFPEFLCDYHFGFCDVIPPNCIQMRNVILSAFPRYMKLPDPFTPNLKVDMLPETNTSPRIGTNFVLNITPVKFRQSLDSYLQARAPVTFLTELRSCLQISNEPGSRYNIPLMNALVLYVGTQAIAHIRSKNLAPNMNTIVHSAHMDIFQNLSVDLENEGRYLFLNAIANQLRYPNSHTNYFSCVLLYLFVEANSEAIQEQITRVLLERLIVNRPHPWGLLITFIELIKNPVYKFWEHDFVHCAPEIKKLFESVARSCMVKANNQQQLGNFETEIQECN